MTRRRHVTHNAEEVVAYVPGRAEVGAEEGPADAPMATDELLWALHGRLLWLSEEWARDADARLDAIQADTYDTADRIDTLITFAIVMVLMVAGVAAIVLALRYLG